MNIQSYEVHLEMFEGPLDLLLFLIKKSDLDIYNIPISEITKEYLSYLDLMKDLNLEVAGEFLVLAATLMQIKSRMLLPSHEEEEPEGPDPREELVNKLLEYQKYKEAAKYLAAQAGRFQDISYRGAPRFSEDEKNLNINVFDLLSTLHEILDQAEDRGIVVKGEEFPVEDRIRKILHMLDGRSYVAFHDVFTGETRKLGILACFLALLELVKLQRIIVRQAAPFADILIYKKEVAADQPAPQIEPIWPVTKVEEN